MGAKAKKDSFNNTFVSFKLIKWSKTKDIYAEGELEWKGDDGDNDMGRLVVERAAEEIGYPPEEKMLMMHIETVDFKYRREKTAYVFKDAHRIDTDLKGFTKVINKQYNNKAHYYIV